MVQFSVPQQNLTLSSGFQMKDTLKTKASSSVTVLLLEVTLLLLR